MRRLLDGLGVGLQIGPQTTGGHRIQAGEDPGVLHPELEGAVTAHRMSGQTPARGARQRAVVPVDILHQVVRDERFPVSGGRRARVHAALVLREGIRHHHDQLARAFGIGAIDRTLDIDEMLPVQTEPTRIGVGEAMQKVKHGIAALGLPRVAGREVHRYHSVRAVALEISH